MKYRCPKCGRKLERISKKGTDAENESFPFCSSRCKLNDLNCWFEVAYQIPCEDTDEGEEIAAQQ